MRFIKNTFEAYKEIWMSLSIILLLLALEYSARRAILQKHLLSSKGFLQVEDDILEAAVIFLILLGGILSYRRRRRKERAELEILRSILITLNSELIEPLNVILADISLLLKSENRLVAENRSVIHRIDCASSKIRDLIFQLSRIDRIELDPQLRIEDDWDVRPSQSPR